MEQKQEFWRWSEKIWQAPDLDWRTASAVTVGIDVGSVSSQAVLLADGKLLSFCSTRTGSNSPDSALRAFKGASEPLGLTLDDVSYAVGTGYGRVNVPFADRTITEIACHARGANFMGGPSVRTILDMGGQDCKVIRCDERGKVLNFIMNDKCAAGTGRGMEVIADVLSVPIEDIGRRSFEIDEEPPAGEQCLHGVREIGGHVAAPRRMERRAGARRLLRGHGAAGGRADRAHGGGAGVLHHRRDRQEHRCDPAHRAADRGGGHQAARRLGARSADRRRPGRGALRPFAASQGAEGRRPRQRRHRRRGARRATAGRPARPRSRRG